MVKGPQEARLDRAVSGASLEQVAQAEKEWRIGADVLDGVAEALTRAAPRIRSQFKETGTAAHDAFTKVAGKVSVRAGEMRSASGALSDAWTAMDAGIRLQQSMGAAPSAPTEPARAPGPMDLDDVRAKRAHDTAIDGYHAEYAARERKANATANHMDEVFERSTETMKKVHGEPDAQPASATSGDGGSGGAGTAPGGGAALSGGGKPGGPTLTSPGPGAPGGPTTGGPDGPGAGPGAGTPTSPGTSQGGTPISPGTTPGGTPTETPATGPTGIGAPTVGGLAGALGGGLIGGAAGIGGAVRGGGMTAVPAGGATAGSGRAIGSTSRTGAGGTLGRGAPIGGTGAGAGARTPGGGPGAARTRGRNGARAAGAVAGRGASKKENGKTRKVEFFDEVHDWVDDEGVAPGVID